MMCISAYSANPSVSARYVIRDLIRENISPISENEGLPSGYVKMEIEHDPVGMM